jgi:hypothetical protein
MGTPSIGSVVLVPSPPLRMRLKFFAGGKPFSAHRGQRRHLPPGCRHFARAGGTTLNIWAKPGLASLPIRHSGDTQLTTTR